MNTLTRRFSHCLAVVLLALGLAVAAPAGPAQAGSMCYDNGTGNCQTCPATVFCIWTGYWSGGNRCQFSWYDLTENKGVASTEILGCPRNGSSFSNHLGNGRTVRLFESGECNYQLWFRNLADGQYANAGGSDWDNRVYSLQGLSASGGSPGWPCY